MILVGVSSALLGGLLALISTDLKRALAYSTISQLGFLFYAVGVGAIFASQFHLLSHALFKALLFFAAGAVIHGTGTRDLARLGGLGERMPVVRNAFIIGSLGLVGVPIANGFWSKDLILEAGLSNGSPLAFAAMLVAAGLTAVYACRLVSRVFFGPPRPHQLARDAAPAMRMVLVALAAGTLVSWLGVAPLGRLMAVGTALEPTGWAPLAAVLSTPTTGASLLALSLGAAAWWWRDRSRRCTATRAAANRGKRRLRFPLAGARDHPRGAGNRWPASANANGSPQLEPGRPGWRPGHHPDRSGVVRRSVAVSGGNVEWLVGLPLATAPIVYLVGRLGRGRTSRPFAAQWSALASLAMAWSIWLNAERDPAPAADTVWRLGAAGLRLDGLGLLVAALALGLVTLVVLFLRPTWPGQTRLRKILRLAAGRVGGGVGRGRPTDLFNMWVRFEVMAVALVRAGRLLARESAHRSKLQSNISFRAPPGPDAGGPGYCAGAGIHRRVELDTIQSATARPSAGLIAGCSRTRSVGGFRHQGRSPCH